MASTKHDLLAAFARGGPFLMEGALGERLKREFHLTPHPEVALAGLLTSQPGRDALAALWTEYAGIARQYGLPFLATTPTRRANRSRMAAAGLDGGLLRESLAFLRTILDASGAQAYAGGMVGCYGEAYTGAGALSEEAAYRFHRWQTALLADGDFLYGALLPTLPEAAGLARAMAETGLPYLLSFTLREDGCLIDGTPLAQAIAAIDSRDFPAPLGYMTNCIHPDLVRKGLSMPWNQTSQGKARFLGIQGNTSPLPYAVLDRATDLLTADPASFARAELSLLELVPLRIFGGCCGTDGRQDRKSVV